MPSSIFGNQSGNSILKAIGTLRSMGNPQSAYSMMYMNNPQFRRFADSMQGKTPEQAFRENGLDFNQVKGLMR